MRANDGIGADHSALQDLVHQRAQGTNCPYMGADIRGHDWQWSDGSTRFYRAVNANSGGSEHCSCWWTADDVIYDAPCESFGGQNYHFICAFEV